MKNKSGFFTRSLACTKAMDEGRYSIRFRCSEHDAWQTGVEWHHGGSGIIAFFPQNENETKTIQNLKNVLGKRTIKTKSAAWRYLEQHNTADGTFEFAAKKGKFGWFKCGYGQPDIIFKISDKTAAEEIEKII